MTIAACYLSTEGVVFGADSTSTFPSSFGVPRHYDYGQKILEVGDRGSTLGIVMWGLGGLVGLSYRTLVAKFAEENIQHPPGSILDISNRFGQFFWHEYSVRQAPQILRLQGLIHAPALTGAEQMERDGLLLNLSGGFCLGGTLNHDRTPMACEITYQPLGLGPNVHSLNFGETGFWGVKNMIMRTLLGIDPDLYAAILASGQWAGTPADLSNLVNQGRLLLPGILPLRDAIDWVYYSVYSTIKAMKFSQLAPCLRVAQLRSQLSRLIARFAGSVTRDLTQLFWMGVQTMPAPSKPEIDQALRDLLENTPPPSWLVDMLEHYRRTGTFRPEDLKRLLGDPSKGVEIGPDTSPDVVFSAFSAPQRNVSPK